MVTIECTDDIKSKLKSGNLLYFKEEIWNEGQKLYIAKYNNFFKNYYKMDYLASFQVICSSFITEDYNTPLEQKINFALLYKNYNLIPTNKLFMFDDENKIVHGFLNDIDFYLSKKEIKSIFIIEELQMNFLYGKENLVFKTHAFKTYIDKKIGLNGYITCPIYFNII